MSRKFNVFHPFKSWKKLPTGGSKTVFGKTLDLPFTTNNTLDPRITFTRSSNATVVGSDGTLQYAPHNLLTYSEQFDNAAWGKANSSVTANATTAPDGSITADTIVATGTAFPRTERTVSGINPGTHTFSVYARANTSAFLHGTFEVAGVNVLRFYANLTTGATSATTSVGTISATITAQANQNGFWRIVVTINVPASGNYNLFVGPSSGFGSSSGTVGLSIDVWGAQLNVGTLQPYYPTTVKNLLGYTQEFDNAAWTKSNSSVIANADVAPDGSMSADKLVENNTNSIHRAEQFPTLTDNSILMWSCYVKAAERSFTYLEGRTKAGTFPGAFFNLSNGTVGTTVSGATAAIQSIGSGWYRCSISFNVSTGASSPYVGVQSAIGSSAFGDRSYLGDGTSGILIWGAQLSDSASLDPYVYNPGAAPSASAYYGPRFDYDPVTLQPKGLLIEEQRTNLTNWSEQFVGNWSSLGVGVISATADSNPSGTTYATKYVPGAGGVSYFNSPYAFTATAGVAYTKSIFIKNIPSATQMYLVLFFNSTIYGSYLGAIFNPATGAITFTATGVTTSVFNYGNGWYRVSATATATAAGLESFQARIGNSPTDIYQNGYGDGVSGFFVYGAQLEAGAFATSYIPTTTAAATRAADVATMTGTNFSSWYNASEGTVYADVSTTGSTGYFWTLMRAGSAYGPRIQNTLNGVNVSYAAVVDDAGSVVVSITRTGLKSAFAYAANDFALVANGGVPILDTSGAVPTSLTQLRLGSSPVGDISINGHIRRIAYYPRRLSNSELTAITS